MKSNYKGLNRIFHACKYSIDGLVATFKSETAFKQDILLCLIAGIVQCFIKVPFYGHVIMCFSLAFIIVAELINTAIETLVDRIGEEYNVLSKKAKDIGSAIVFVSIVSVAVLWLVVIIG